MRSESDDQLSKTAYTDVEVQDILTAAIKIVSGEVDYEANRHMPNDLAISQLTILKSLFVTLRYLTKTSNGIIGLRGLGMEEGVELARQLVEDEIKPQLLHINLRSAFQGITG